MLLNEQQVEEAKERAAQVVNGFATIRAQQARDALNLAETLQLRNKQLAALVAEMEKRATGKNTADIFGDMFDKNSFGKDIFADGGIFGEGGIFGKNSFGRRNK